MSIDAGTYKGRAIAGSEQYGKTSNGNDQIVLELDIGGGVTVSTFLYFSDAAAPYAIKRLRACGWTGDDLSSLVGVDANEVDVAVKYEEYKGEQKMKVDIVTGGTVTLETPLDDKEKRAFAARFKGLAASSRPATNGGPAKAEDFPFGNNQKSAGGVKL